MSPDPRIKPIPLLPFERVLASELGVDERTYGRFKAYVAQTSRIDTSCPQMGPGAITFLIKIVIGVGLMLLASLLFRQSTKSPRIDQKVQDPKNVTANQAAAPRFGFDQAQDIAKEGQRVPLVIARREVAADGIRYGGVRVNLTLLWSQMWSLNGSQLFRGLYLLGHGPMGQIEASGFALGDNPLTGFEIGSATYDVARYSLYYVPNGGRPTSAHHIGGRLPAKDPANAQNFGGPDVLSYVGLSGAIQRDFCCTAKPSTATRFGLYGHCPNGMGYRVSPGMRPTRTCYIKPKKDDYFVRCDDETQSLASFWKSKYHWSTRSGLRYLQVGGSGGYTEPAAGFRYVLQAVSAGDALIYRLEKQTVAEKRLIFNETNADIGNDLSETELVLDDVGSTVASIQRQADENLIEGELYKIGSALCILQARETDFFESEADNEPVGGGQAGQYRFIVVRGGTVGFVGADVVAPWFEANDIAPPYYTYRDPFTDEILDYVMPPNDQWAQAYTTCSAFPQIFRCSVATFGVTRATQMIEIGFKSTVGMNVSGLCNFRSCPTMAQANSDAGQRKDGDKVGDSFVLNASIFQSGALRLSNQPRYSPYALYYRDGEGAWTRFDGCAFALKSGSGDIFYSALRVEFPAVSPAWQVRLEPLSSWELREAYSFAFFAVVEGGQCNHTIAASGIKVSWNGGLHSPAEFPSLFDWPLADAKFDIGYGFTEGNTMLDQYALAAEKFVYQEVSTTVDRGIEHEVAYVNVFTPNAQLATYNRLALVALNLQAGADATTLTQASQMVNYGHEMKQLLNNDLKGSTHLWPDLYRYLLTSDELGHGAFYSDDQLDLDSFRAAAQWCYDRRYFWDGVLIEPENLLDWAGQMAAACLLNVVPRGAKIALAPALVFNAPVPIKALFTNGNIREKSLEFRMIPYEDRRPVKLIGKYRSESTQLTGYKPGIFPQEKTITVQEAGRPETDPMEVVDISDWCTSTRQLIDALALELRRRRLVDHTVSFQTTPEGLTAGLANGDYIQLALDYVYYDVHASGIITSNGIVSTSRPDLLPPGDHVCVVWDGTDADATEETITFYGDGTASIAGVMFALKQEDTRLRTYEITKLSITPEGYIAVEARHHPTDENGWSLLAKDWPTYATNEHWTIRY